tara:strand:+ start:4611 stop:5606 length:996 start_codon:yes stop_codon:yes gene_type:complete
MILVQMKRAVTIMLPSGCLLEFSGGLNNVYHSTILTLVYPALKVDDGLGYLVMNKKKTVGGTSVGTHVSQADICRGLQALGLQSGDLVVTHSSLSSFGYVEGGAAAVVDALLETVGTAGTLIMPSHTGLGKYDFGAYDPSKTPVRKAIGAIPDTFWRRPGVRRGNYPPRHPWAAKGPLASPLIEYSEGHPIAAGHCLDILVAVADLGGYVLLLGCMNRNNTSMHSAQVTAFNELEDACKPKREFLRSSPKRPEDFDAVDQPLRHAGAVEITRIGDAVIQLMRSRDLFDVVKKMYISHYRTAGGNESILEDIPDPDGIRGCYAGLMQTLKRH